MSSRDRWADDLEDNDDPEVDHDPTNYERPQVAGRPLNPSPLEQLIQRARDQRVIRFPTRGQRT
jgi:hypothetical protein